MSPGERRPEESSIRGSSALQDDLKVTELAANISSVSANCGGWNVVRRV